MAQGTTVPHPQASMSQQTVILPTVNATTTSAYYHDGIHLHAQAYTPAYSPALSHTSTNTSSSSSSTPSRGPKARSSTSCAKTRAPAKVSPPSSHPSTACPLCGVTFTRAQDCRRHRESVHKKSGFVCCGVPIETALSLGVQMDTILTMNTCEYRGMKMVGGCWDPATAGQPRAKGTFSRDDTYKRHLRVHHCLGDPSAWYFSSNAL